MAGGEGSEWVWGGGRRGRHGEGAAEWCGVRGGIKGRPGQDVVCGMGGVGVGEGRVGRGDKIVRKHCQQHSCPASQRAVPSNVCSGMAHARWPAIAAVCH